MSLSSSYLPLSTYLETIREDTGSLIAHLADLLPLLGVRDLVNHYRKLEGIHIGPDHISPDSELFFIDDYLDGPPDEIDRIRLGKTLLGLHRRSDDTQRHAPDADIIGLRQGDNVLDPLKDLARITARERDLELCSEFRCVAFVFPLLFQTLYLARHIPLLVIFL